MLFALQTRFFAKAIARASIKASEEILYSPTEAFTLVKAYAIAPFDESVDVAVRLAIDPKRTDQLVRGSCAMPAGLGKQVKVAVFTSDMYKEQAIEAGADYTGDELFRMVQNDNFTFDKVLATPDMLDVLKPYARKLGPKGLMPTVKYNTIVNLSDLKQAIQDMKKGALQFRMNTTGIIHAPIGRVSFSEDALMLNFKTFMRAIIDLRPASLKGKYIKTLYMSSTQGPSWRLDTAKLDFLARKGKV